MLVGLVHVAHGRSGTQDHHVETGFGEQARLGAGGLGAQAAAEPQRLLLLIFGGLWLYPNMPEASHFSSQNNFYGMTVI